MAALSSLELRTEGRKKFMEAFQCNDDDALTKKNPGTRIEYGKEAIKLFGLARKASLNRNDWASATKNYAVASHRLGSMPEFQYRNKSNPEAVHYYFKEALKFGIECYVHGQMAVEWHLSMKEAILAVVKSIAEFVATRDHWRFRCGELHGYLSLCQEGGAGGLKELEPLIYLQICKECFKSVITLCEDDGWIEALQCVRELGQYIQFAEHSLSKAHGGSGGVREHFYYLVANELEDLRTSHFKYMRISESAQAKHLADEAMRSLLQDEDELNMDLAWDVVDRYKQAILLATSCNGQCLESEAIAGASLGIFYSTVLKSDKVANGYMMHAIMIVDNITHATGKTFFNIQWYQETKAQVEAYRRRAFNTDTVSEERDAALVTIKPKLDAIKVAMDKFEGRSYRCHALLVHIYECCPPKQDKKIYATLDKDDKSSLNKAVLHAVSHYHTDKSFNKTDGVEWFVLCEEICKLLNGCLSDLKGV
jgi:hypothetical protein